MNSKVKVNINTQVIESKLSKAMAAYSKEIDQNLDHQFFDSKWEWPRLTRRRSGRTVGSPRDIIDTGELLNSKQGPTPIGGKIGYRWTWNTPYASLVKNGYISRTGEIVPARDWIKAALRELPFAEGIFKRIRK